MCIRDSLRLAYFIGLYIFSSSFGVGTCHHVGPTVSTVQKRERRNEKIDKRVVIQKVSLILFVFIYRSDKKAQEQQTFIVLLFPRLYSLHCCQCGTSIWCKLTISYLRPFRKYLCGLRIISTLQTSTFVNISGGQVLTSSCISNVRFWQVLYFWTLAFVSILYFNLDFSQHLATV